MAGAKDHDDVREKPLDSGAPAGERRKPWVFEFAWIGAAGILLFVVLRFPIAAFYRKLGTTPEEVGLDYTLILTQSSPAVVVLLIVCAIWYWVLNKMAGDPRMTTISNELSQYPRPDMRREVLRSLNDDAFERRMQEAQEYWSHTERDRKIFLRRSLRYSGSFVPLTGQASCTAFLWRLWN